MCPCNQPSWHKRSRRDPHGPCTSASRNNTHASVRTLQATAIARIALLLHLLVAACPRQQPQSTIHHHKALTVGAVAALPAGEGPSTATIVIEAVVPGEVAIRATSDSDMTELDNDGCDE